MWGRVWRVRPERVAEAPAGARGRVRPGWESAGIVCCPGRQGNFRPFAETGQSVLVVLTGPAATPWTPV